MGFRLPLHSNSSGLSLQWCLDVEKVEEAQLGAKRLSLGWKLNKKTKTFWVFWDVKFADVGREVGSFCCVVLI